MPPRSFFVFVILALCGCASVNSVPKFDGEISPVTTPIDLQYRPCFGHYVTAMSITYGTEKAHFSANSSYKGMKVGENFRLFTTIDQMSVNGRTMRHKLPLAEIDMLMTTKGAKINTSVSFPGFHAVGVSVLKGSSEYENIAKSIDKTRRIFPSTAVVTGDVAAFNDDSDMRFVDSPSGSIGYVLAGTSTYSNKKVYVFTISLSDVKVVQTHLGKDSNLIINVDGYELLDVKTMTIIKSDILFSGKDITNGKMITVRGEVYEF